MFKTLRNAFKVKDIRNKLLFTLLMLVVVRIGCQIPIPGFDTALFKEWFESVNQSGSMSFFSAITGGSFEQMSIFALNITPYITSSIIMQLMTIAIPALEEMHKDGEDGRKKIATITRFVTVGLALIQSTAMAIGFGRSGYLGYDWNAWSVIQVIAILTAGSAVLMWIGERITEKGVGNGISIVLTINIISRIPNDMSNLWQQFVTGQKSIANSVLAVIVILAVIIFTIVFVDLLQNAERRIPVQYSRKIQGRTQGAGGSSTVIPLKVNTAGVIPIIFAQSIMQFPIVIATITGHQDGQGFGYEVLKVLNQSYWCNPKYWIYTIGLLIYIALIIAFAYFYTSITFNPLEVADNMKKQGGFVPGIRPGKPTSDFLKQMLSYVIFIGACGLSIVAIIPIFFNGVFNASVSFAGTSIIIIVGVIVETIKQIESQMVVRHYKGFLGE